MNKKWIAFWNIMLKDIKTYYLKPPNISWGLIFPLAWTGMFFIRSGMGMENIMQLLPGVMGISVLFGTTSMLAVTVTFEKKGRSFDRLLLAPISLELLMLSKTIGAIIFGTINAFIPLIIAIFFVDLGGINWFALVLAVILIAVSSTFLGLLIAVTAKEVFEAQTYSNFFRFPMLFLCGLFFPIASLPIWLKPLSFILPLTYGNDMLNSSIGNTGIIPTFANILILILFCVVLFFIILKLMRKNWIL